MDTTFGILGGTALLIDGSPREDWGRPKERAVLGALLVHAGRWVSVDTLLDWAWQAETALPRNRGPTFHHYAARIRKGLALLPSPPALQPGNGGYRLDVDKNLVDYYRFTGLLADARAQLRRHAPREAADTARVALKLWRGRPLDDLAGEPAAAWRRRVRDEWLAAQTTLLDALLALERFDEVLVRLTDLQTDHPHDVTLATRRLSALHGLGRYADEIMQFLGSRRRLQHEGDDQAVRHLQSHHDRLLASAPEPGSAPPPARAIVPRQLRPDIPDFVGRDDLLADLDAATTDGSGRPVGGVVVLDGMAGVGKTTLAVHWAHTARSRFPDGDLYADLAGYSAGPRTPPSTVVDDFLIALGHAPDRSMTGRARELLLTRLVSDRRILAVLDNAKDTAHVEGLVSLLPGALVVVTSRQRLSKLSARTGARHVRVAPMSGPDAETLLSARIGTRRRTTASERTSLATMCGGLPLLVTLLAEHLASRPGEVADVVAELNPRRLILDIGEDGDGSGYALTFDWSYQALAEPERRLFRLLGLMPGEDIGVDAACACDGRTRVETMRSLRVLAGAHLVEQPVALDRYRFHDLLAEFATHRAEVDEPDHERQAAARRIVGFYLASADRANRLLYPSRVFPSGLPDAADPVVLADAPQARAWFERERRCLVAAAHFAASTGHHHHCWRLVDTVGTYLDRNGYHRDGVELRRIAASSARIAGDREGEASSLNNLGKAYLDLGEHAEARRCLNAALRIVEADDHAQGQATILNLLGKLELRSGDPVAALGLYRRSLAIAERIGDRRAMTWMLSRLGEVLRISEQHDEALVRLREARRLAERLGDRSAEASSMAEIGLVHRDRGDLTAAAEHCEAALRLAEEIPDLLVVAQVCTDLAEIGATLDVEAALGHVRRAISLSQLTRNLAPEAHAHDVHGDILFAHGAPDDAVAAWSLAIERYEQIDSPSRAALVRAKVAAAPQRSPRLPAARGDSPRMESTLDIPASGGPSQPNG